MSEEARKRLKDLREKIGANDTAIRHARQKQLECIVSLKILKAVKLALAAKNKEDIEQVWVEIDKQAVQIVNHLRENI
jgi:hypothetical protein